MGYCTVAEVEANMRTTFTPTTKPAIGQIEGFIANASSRLDGVAQAAGYDVPVTDTIALGLMKDACIFGVSCRAWHAGWFSDTAPARAEYWCTEYREFLASLRKGEVQLPGVEPESDLDPAFAIVQQPPRDTWFTGRDEGLE
jgi:hypothetical protein